MNEAQKAFQKLIDGVGNLSFYITTAEVKAIEEKLAVNPAQTKKQPAKKTTGKK